MTRPATAGWRGLLALTVLGGANVLGGCSVDARVPPPKDAIEAYAAAVERGDVDRIYGMLSRESKRGISRDELARVMKDQAAEMKAHAAGLKKDDRTVKAEAKVRYADGEVVTLEVTEGRFRVAAADALPAAARTPDQALGQLRRVLARRSYPGLLRVLSPRTRAAVEADLRSLVEGLSEPDALRIDETGDRASVVVPGGHRVTLKKVDGLWYVDDFD